MFFPRIMLTLFNGDWDAPAGERAVLRFLEALIETNVDYLKEHPATPGIYASGVRYKRQQGNQEDWHDIPTAISVGVTDCKVLVAWRIAELRVRGIRAVPHLLRQEGEGRKYLYHVVLKFPDGTIEDPSRILGMS